MINHTYDFLTPKTLEEAERLYKQYENPVFFAGGTDIIPRLKYNLISPDALISINKIKEMCEIKQSEARLHIGAMVTLRQMQQFAKANPAYTAFYDAASRIASPQIQTVGTVGGNILQKRRCLYYNQTAKWRTAIAPCYQTGGDVCHQMPAKNDCAAIYYSDLAPLFLVLDAIVSVYRDGKLLEMSMQDIFEKKETNFGIVRDISIPLLGAESRLYFEKYAVRSSIDFPLSNAALYIKEPDCVRVAIGALSPIPFILPETSAKFAEYIRNEHIITDDFLRETYKEVMLYTKPIREATVSITVKKQAGHVATDIIRNALC